MKKFLLIGAATLMVSNSTFAGGYLTNTNQHAAFLRMIARGTTSDIDAVYSNPAGLTWMKKEGFALSFSVQNASQNRDIDAKYSIYDYKSNPAKPGMENYSQYYTGDASAPFIPSFFVTYKKNDWVLSGSFAVVGGGGKASYDFGLPMFDSALRFGLANNEKLVGFKNALKAKNFPVNKVADLYDLNTAMDGSQIIYGVQIGATYKVYDWLSVFVGGRMNYFNGNYKGYAEANVKENYSQIYQQATGSKDNNITRLALDCDQTGWGLTPIIAASVKYKGLTASAKFESITNLNLENTTHENTDPNGALAAFAHGVNTPSDIPGFISLAVGYDVLPSLRAAVEYHHYFDKNARMAENKQEELSGGTNEFLAGIEWDAHKYVTISAGYQNTDYGLSDNFQTDTSFSCDSNSYGFGAKLNLSSHVQMNIAYFWTDYKDYTKTYTNTFSMGEQTLPSVTGSNTYKRTNKVFGVSLDYTF